MNRLIIIGNGFDLSHGLRTNYGSFIYSYLIDAVNEFYTEGKYDNPLLKIKFRGSYTHFKPQPPPATIETIKDDFKKLRDHTDVTVEITSIIISESFNRLENLKWVDIESIYFNLLMDYSNKLDPEEHIKSLNEEFAVVKSLLIKYLEKEQKRIPIDVDRDYINLFYESFDKTRGYGNQVMDNTMYFLNFNYTNTLIKYYNYCSNDFQTDLNYIHGSLNKKYGGPIFGYGDEFDERYIEHKNTQNTEIFRNIKSYEYLREANFQMLSKFIHSYEYDVLIFGHSCGLSDRTLLKQIFEHDNCVRIKVFYYQDKKGNNDFIEKTYDIARHFDDNVKLRERLVPFSLSEKLP